MLTLDASGGAARQRVLVVGDQSRCQLAGKSSAPELQEVRSCSRVGLVVARRFGAPLVLRHSHSTSGNPTCGRQPSAVTTSASEPGQRSPSKKLISPAVPTSCTSCTQAGINHFLDCVTAAAQPRLSAADVIRAAAVMAAARESLRTGAPAAVDYSLSGASATAGEAPLAGATATVRLAAGAAAHKAAAAAASLVEGAKKLVSGGTGGTAARKDDEGGVSTPPHQGTPPPKAGPGTPDSPPLLPAPHRA